MHSSGLFRNFHDAIKTIRHYITRVLMIALISAGLAQPAHAFTVSGNKIIDDASRTVTLKGLNWFGFETDIHTVHGLWTRNWKQMLDQIQATGFNA